MAGSTVTLPNGSQPGDVLFNADGTRLAGTRIGTSQIDSFTVGDDGRLAAAPGSPFPAQGLGPFGSEFRPTNPDQLFVSNAHNAGAGSGTISAFRDAADGTLTSIGSSPFADLQTAPCWVEISHDDQILKLSPVICSRRPRRAASLRVIRRSSSCSRASAASRRAPATVRPWSHSADSAPRPAGTTGAFWAV